MYLFLSVTISVRVCLHLFSYVTVSPLLRLYTFSDSYQIVVQMRGLARDLSCLMRFALGKTHYHNIAPLYVGDKTSVFIY